MSPRRTRQLIVVLVVLVIGFVIVRAFQPTPILVDVSEIQRRTLQVTVDDDGITRVCERYRVSAPLDGRLVRVTLEPGDPVEAGVTIVAEFEPLLAPLLSRRARAEAEARVAQAEAGIAEAQALEAGARADLRFALRDLERQRKLVESGSGQKFELERAERDEVTARQGVSQAVEAKSRAEFELDLARASLIDPDANNAAESAASTTIPLRSPISGQVLRVLEESQRSLTVGTPILEVGDPSQIEVVADYLSQDAVQVRSGMNATFDGWRGETGGELSTTLKGVVERVEPSGYTKVSALGVDEQRVDIVLRPDAVDANWKSLKDGYRVQVSIVIWEERETLVVPTGALFREGDQWSVFVDDGGTAHRRDVEIGRRNGLEAQLISGLQTGDQVVLYPSELIAEGARIEARR